MPTLLLVDPHPHSPLTQLLTGHTLHGLTPQLEYACQGVEAVDKALHLKPDVILLSRTLPGMSGLETCKKIKESAESETIPVLFFFENLPEQAEILQAFQAGANDVMVLCQSQEELLARIEGALKYKQTLNKAEALSKQLSELNEEFYERNREVEKELYIARQLQQSLLPPVLMDPALDPDLAALQISKPHYLDHKIKITGLYLPCDALGGDLYDVIPFPNNTIGVSIADVSGHGVPAGFITAIYKAAFYRITHTYETPGDILFHLNNELAGIVKTGEYVTCLYARLKEDGTRLEYTGAGHPYPIYYRAADQTIHRLTENGTPLVWLKDMDYPMGEIDLFPGDKVLMFTDGISEIKNPQREIYGEEALEALFLQVIQEDPPSILDQIIGVLSDYTQGHPLEDDMSMVLIEARP